MFDCQDKRHGWYRPKVIGNHKSGINLETAEIVRVTRWASKNLQTLMVICRGRAAWPHSKNFRGLGEKLKTEFELLVA